MQEALTVITEPGPADVKLLAELYPENPFATFGYAQAQVALGMQALLICSGPKDKPSAGCLGFLRTGRLNRRLNIPSSPPVQAGSQFWRLLENYCREQKISILELDSFASPATYFPRFKNEERRSKRTEYMLTLSEELSLASSHKRNVKRGEREGLKFKRSSAVTEAVTHAQLIAQSLSRRTERGEEAEGIVRQEVVAAFLEHRAAEVFQAVRSNNGVEEACSSMLVLRSERGAYYHSAGTSPEGMNCGASHFLLNEIAQVLRAGGLRRFNLAGADPENAGLERYKRGFGAQPVKIEAVRVFLGTPLQAVGRKLLKMIQ